MKKPTILDVAHEAGVSKSLVSRVMQDSPLVSAESRRAVVEAAEKLGYRPNAAARTMVRQRSSSVGLVVSDFDNPFFGDVIAGVDAAAHAAGMRVVLMGANRDAARERDAIRSLLEMRVDALVLASPTLATSEVVALAAEIPTAVVGRPTRGTPMASVANNDRLGARLVVEHLVTLGHRRIAHIDGGQVAGARARRTGYERAMRDHGLAGEAHVVAGAFTQHGGEAGMRQVLDLDDRPTAVFAADDFAAIGALQAIDEAGLCVPGDVSLVGYDNTWLAGIHRLDLTSVEQPRREMGRLATEAVLDLLDGGGVRHELLDPTLVIRNTTAPPREL
jgi:DNA-binding LacI/PurR family transcriptional regulator